MKKRVGKSKFKKFTIYIYIYDYFLTRKSKNYYELHSFNHDQID
jgi:hypothetical protein